MMAATSIPLGPGNATAATDAASCNCATAGGSPAVGVGLVNSDFKVPHEITDSDSDVRRRRRTIRYEHRILVMR